jgi:hypothetical protein
VNGVAQAFGVLAPRDVQIGKKSVRQVSFVMPMNSVGGVSALRKEGLLPTMAFQRMFISYSGAYAALEPW